MPVLILNFPNMPPGGLVLEGRVVIGRRPFDTILVPDPTVSRIHAWIGAKNGRFFVCDAGSRSGTLLNDQPLTERRDLSDGDEIRVGPATLTFIDADELPADIQPLAPASPPPASDPYDGGIYFDCPCGGPMWVTADLAGAAGRCRYCGQRLVVPHMSGQTARLLAPVGATGAAARRIERSVPEPARPVRRTPPKSSAPAFTAPMDEPGGIEQICSICQTEIHADEEQTRCPSCHLTFHRQCWEENYGCSAYGCDQVNVLAPETGAQPDRPVAVDEVDRPPENPSRHWDLVLVALSFVGLGLGPLAFGATSAIMLVWTAMFLFQRKTQRRMLAVLGLVVSILGTIAGFVTSMFLFKGVRLWEKLF